MKMSFDRLRQIAVYSAFSLGLIFALGQNAVAAWNSPQDWVVAGATFNIQQGGSISGAPVGTWGGNGGEFKVSVGTSPNANAQISEFYTFCVELTEYLTNPSYVASVGGVSLQTNIQLSAVTSALYREFLRNKGTNNAFFATNGSFSSTAPSLDRTYNDVGSANLNDATQFQRAIWHFQGAQVAFDANNGFMRAGLDWANSVNGGFLNALLPGNVSLYGGVSIMNLTNASGARAQDQLVYRTGPGSGNIVPEPASFALFVCGMVGFCGCFRRRSAY
jgi:hypothetical protein